MNTQPASTPIVFQEIVDNFIIYSIGSRVYQIEIEEDDLEFVFGVESRNWESPSGQSFSDDCAVISTLAEVHESDYLTLITSTMSKSEDITDAYEKPVTPFEKELFRVAMLSHEENVRIELCKLMIESR